jgi:hypothetical protein
VRRHGAVAGRRLHVALHDAATRAGARNERREVDAGVRGEAAGDRRGGDACGHAVRAARGGPCGRTVRGGGRRRAVPAYGRLGALGQQLGQGGAEVDGLTLLGQAAQDAGALGLVGHRRLVGLDLDELLAHLDAVAVGLQPADDGALLHGVGEAGHDDGGHGRNSA